MQERCELASESVQYCLTDSGTASSTPGAAPQDDIILVVDVTAGADVLEKLKGTLLQVKPAT